MNWTTKQADLISKTMWENRWNEQNCKKAPNRVENVPNCVDNVQNRVENVQNVVENVQNRVENVQIFWEDEPKLSFSASSWLQVEYSTGTVV